MTTSRRDFFKKVFLAGAAATVPSLLTPGKVEAKTVDKPTYGLTEEFGRYEHKNIMFCRALWDEEYIAHRATLVQREVSVEKEHDAMALNITGWHVHNYGAQMNAYGIPAQPPLMRWDDPVITMDEVLAEAYSKLGSQPTDNPMIWDDKPAPNCYKAEPEVLSRKIKNAALFLGAGCVGVAELNPNWVWSNYFDFKEKKSKPWPRDPAQFKYVVAVGIEMRYEPWLDLQSYNASASAGLGYSHMIEVACSLARFIRLLGYPAIPIGNDTMNTIPAAIEAGLGELGRNGLVITPQFGPRVRLCAVLTDAPLAVDKPIDMGVKKFCSVCRKCADKCPNGAIVTGEPTDKIHNISNRPGVIRWPVDGQKCFDFWRINRSACNVCSAVCPYNKPAGTWFHEATPAVIEHASPLNRALVFLDEFMGYGAKKPFKL